MIAVVLIAIGIIFYMNKNKIAEAVAPSIYPSYVRAVSIAIATAEGFFAPGNPLPKRANNPGDLMLGDKGNGTIAGKTIFGSIDEGWAALDHEVYLIVSGKSHVYTPDMSIAKIATLYTGNDAPDSWAATVAESLGIDVDTSLGEYGSKNS